jgi:hypothetical protein
VGSGLDSEGGSTDVKLATPIKGDRDSLRKTVLSTELAGTTKLGLKRESVIESSRMPVYTLLSV